MDREFMGLMLSQWLDIGISILIVVAVLVLGRWLINLLLTRGVTRITRHTRTTLDDTMIGAIRPPLYLFAIVGAFDLAINRLAFLDFTHEPAITKFFFVLYFLCGLVLIWRVLNSLFDWYEHEIAERFDKMLSQQLLPFFRRVALAIVLAIAVIILLGRFGVEVSGLVATLGVTSLVIGLAAQAALEDTISGFLIMIDRPYRIGDRIDIQDLDTVGDVVDIGLRSSRIRTIDNRMVIVPNSVIGKSLVVNRAYPDTQYRIYVQVGVAYGTDVDRARTVMLDAVRGVEGVVLPPEDAPEHTAETYRDVEVLFTKMGDSALVFDVRFWVNTYADTYVIADRVNTAIYKALNANNIEIPFPQRDVHHKFAPGEVEVLAKAINGHLTEKNN